MKEQSNLNIFKKARIKLILPKYDKVKYYGCAIKMDLPINKMRTDFQLAMYGTKDQKLFDKETVYKIQSTLDELMNRH